jgi:hypothetical protein
MVATVMCMQNDEVKTNTYILNLYIANYLQYLWIILFNDSVRLPELSEMQTEQRGFDTHWSNVFCRIKVHAVSEVEKDHSLIEHFVAMESENYLTDDAYI